MQQGIQQSRSRAPWDSRATTINETPDAFALFFNDRERFARPGPGVPEKGHRRPLPTKIPRRLTRLQQPGTHLSPLSFTVPSLPAHTCTTIRRTHEDGRPSCRYAGPWPPRLRGLRNRPASPHPSPGRVVRAPGVPQIRDPRTSKDAVVSKAEARSWREMRGMHRRTLPRQDRHRNPRATRSSLARFLSR